MINHSLSSLLFLVGTQPIFQLEIQHFLLSFCHLSIQRLQGGLEHTNSFLERCFSFCNIVFYKHSSQHFPTLAFTLQRL